MVSVYMDKSKDTLLLQAARNGDIRKLRRALRAGANINASNFDSEKTALHLAAQAGHPKVVKRLLSVEGIKKDARDVFKATPLHAASAEGHDDIVKMLLNAGANPNVDDLYGTTPLHEAALGNHTAVVKRLLKAPGIRLNPVCHKLRMPNYPGGYHQFYFSGTPLHVAAKRDNPQIVRLLLNAGANPNSKTRRHETALHMAAKIGNPEIAADLLHAGADVNARSNVYHQTPLHCAANVRSNVRRGDKSIIETLLKAGARPNLQSQNIGTPLHLAARTGQNEKVKMLLEGGATINASRRPAMHSSGPFIGYSPLHDAAERGHLSTVRTLIEAGANMHKTTNNSRTPLHLASGEGHKNVVGALLESGARPNLKNAHGYLPLHRWVTKHLTWNPDSNEFARYPNDSQDTDAYREIRDKLVTRYPDSLTARTLHVPSWRPIWTPAQKNVELARTQLQREVLACGSALRRKGLPRNLVSRVLKARDPKRQRRD
jgi:ankyrin repeat protein